MLLSANPRLTFIAATLLFCLHIPAVSGQQDFNRFQTLQAAGDIPNDFTTSTQQKIEDDLATGRTNLPPAEEKKFLNGIHRSIDRLLQSGSVIYGDEVTQYVEAVAANLLRDKPELLSSLRFYTIKSNTTNAFSTDQGIVFVTTGLIAQLSSEAQLAYVLAHEISHFTEKHVVETFDYQQKNRYVRNIEKLSAYSREHELDADRIALRLYHAAGYDDSEILSVFDVLMYSYLPFDEVELPNSYFSSGPVFIPEEYFASKKYPIKAEEDYDDARSTHPNIRKRKDAAVEGMAQYANWGTTLHSQGESQFYYVRNLSRFESVRTDIIDARFGTALYSIYLLEREFPHSVYLQRMKAEAWLGIAQFKQANELNSTMPGTSDYEGESAAMYFFLKKLNETAAVTLAIRQVYDIRQELPEDPMIAGILDRLMKTAAASDYFLPENFSRKGFRESAEAARMKKDSLAAAGQPTGESGQTKYDKIRTKKNVNAPESFDSSKYYLYAIPDVMQDSLLLGIYRGYKAEFDSIEKAETAYRKLTKQEKLKYDKAHPESLGIGLDKCILISPSVISYSKGEVNRERSESYEAGLSEAVNSAAEKTGVEVTQLTQEDIVLHGTASFNERNVLYSFLEQAAHSGGREFFPIDFDQMKAIEQTYGTSNLAYSLVEHYYHADINPAVVLGSFILFPTLPLTVGIYIPVQLIRGHHSEISLLMLDATTGELKLSAQKTFHARPLQQKLDQHLTVLFKDLQSEPK